MQMRKSLFIKQMASRSHEDLAVSDESSHMDMMSLLSSCTAVGVLSQCVFGCSHEIFTLRRREKLKLESMFFAFIAIIKWI